MTTTRAAIYCRVSTTDQAADDRSSLGQQEERARAYATAQGWDVAAVYVEEGASGALALAERPQGARLLADAAAGKFDRLVVLKMDRLSRNARHLLNDTHALGSLDPPVGVAFVAEAIDTSTSSGRLFRTMLAGFAEFERDTTATRVMAGRRGNAEAGRYPGAPVPYGFATDDGEVVEHPTEADVVRRVFALRAGGDSIPAIAERFNAEGVASRVPGSVWGASSVRAILDIGRTSYMGEPITREVDGEVFAFDAPALVTPAEWAAAHAERKGRQPVKNAGSKRRRYALSERVRHFHGTAQEAEALVADLPGDVEGWLASGEYDAPTMYGNARHRKNGTVARFYRCTRSRKLAHRKHDCPGLGEAYGQTLSATSSDTVEASVLLWALDLLADRDRLGVYLRTADRALLAGAGGVEDPEAVRASLARLTTKRERLGWQHAEGLIADDALRTAVARLDAERSGLEAALARAEGVEEAREVLARNVEALLAQPIGGGPEEVPGWEKADADTSGEWLKVTTSDGRNVSQRVTDTDTDGGHHSAERVATLRGLAVESLIPGKYGVAPALPEWAVAEVERYARALGVEVWLAENPEDPQRPVLFAGFRPGGLLAAYANGNGGGLQYGGQTEMTPS